MDNQNLNRNTKNADKPELHGLTCSPNPLAVECVQLKEKLGRAGLYETMQKMDAVVNAIGWELANKG